MKDTRCHESKCRQNGEDHLGLTLSVFILHRTLEHPLHLTSQNLSQLPNTGPSPLNQYLQQLSEAPISLTLRIASNGPLQTSVQIQKMEKVIQEFDKKMAHAKGNSA